MIAGFSNTRNVEDGVETIMNAPHGVPIQAIEAFMTLTPRPQVLALFHRLNMEGLLAKPIGGINGLGLQRLAGVQY
jgi:hypothetical protein